MPGLRLLALGTTPLSFLSDTKLIQLYLDGGGVRGLVTLIILKRLLFLINRDNPPKPCDVFNVIAGTSTGGLIAIMLGLFQMDIQTCIDTYLNLSKVVFRPRRREKVFGRKVLNLLGHAPFDHSLLEQEIKSLAFQYLGDENALLYQETAKCKVFVCTSLANTVTVRLRSYKSDSEDPISCTIWEAGRATSAAPMFFDPITFSNGLVFRDGALRANNPTSELVQEVTTEFPSEEISAIVSIGTGLHDSITMGNGLASVAKACGKIATDTEECAKKFEKDFCSPGDKFHGKYFRFNVAKGVEGVGLEEWYKADTMISNTLCYLAGPTTITQLGACAKALRVEGAGANEPSASPKSRDLGLNHSSISVQRGLVETRIPKLFISGEDESQSSDLSRNPFYQLDRIEKVPVPYFIFRKELDQIRDHFRLMNTPNGSRVLCLLGLGGSGKTQLTLQYAWSEREQFGVVLWIDAGSRENISASFKLAASQLGLRLPPHEAALSTNQAVTKHQPEFESDRRAVTQELLRRNQRWLLIFDQADDEKLFQELRRYMPSDSRNGHILLSSRRREACQLGQKFINVEGLSPQGARDLLLYHAGIQNPTNEQLADADQVVHNLDCIALAVDLAGSYIQSPGGLQRYLDLYKKNKEELFKRSLGKEPPKVTGYGMSVFVAWQTSITAISENTAKFLYLLCFLDPTNLSKDLFQRACTEKAYWTKSGQWGLLNPAESGVPSWLLELFCGPAKKWCEFQFHEVVNQLASFFFVRQENFKGPWLHPTGIVDTSSLVTEGNTISLLKLPQPLHDLGRYYHTEETRREFCYEAFSVLIHGFCNGIPHINDIDLAVHEPAHLYVGRGGEAQDAATLQRNLEEFERHIQILRHDIEPNTKYFSPHQYRCFNDTYPSWHTGEVIMFASIWWQDLLAWDRNRALRREYEGPIIVNSPWETVMEIADTLIDSTVKFDDDKYYNIISRSDKVQVLEPIFITTTLYRITSHASHMALNLCWSSKEEFLKALAKWVRTKIGNMHLSEENGIFVPCRFPERPSFEGSDLFSYWKQSLMGQTVLKRLEAYLYTQTEGLILTK
ncbi:hypothetical protein F4680DRAFT_407402 [Xylaria scruposa]|nr:hypothetical protein F4680DRAFT_407402 [Xylaria scruposa]